MHQNHFSNPINKNCSPRFYHPTTPTIVDRIVFPQMVNDVRYQSSNMFDPRHLDLQNTLKLDTHFNGNVDIFKNHDKNEFYDNYRYMETQLPSKQNYYKNTSRSQVLEVKARISVDVSTMTDPLTIEEQERLGQWEGFAAVQSGNKVAEYLTSLREFLKLSPPQEGKRRQGLGDVRIVTSPDGSRLYCCSECLMAYTDKTVLEHHLANHKVERRFICMECGAGLKRKEHLDRHQLSHSDQRPYTCAACPKTFKRNEHLARHYIVHSGEKAHVCVECGKAFYRRDHLQKHVQGHITKRLKAVINAVV
ncbi:zinc finger protein 120-like [Melanaphis sacchari]|uniref:Zinc finger protein 436 n=1 Tax=Melanaphis sacchari TaxID=742174 RepID=A0A2H8TY58_9HEMI|nr:zinc finger protein 120-like [Melanaphis sacchari]